MRSRFGASCLASICRCMQDFYLSTTFFTLSLSLATFIHIFVHLRKVGGFPGSRSQSRTKIFAREVFSLRQGPRTTNFFPSQPLPSSFSTYPNRKKKNTRFSFEYPTITMDPRSRACYNCAFLVLCLLCSPMTRTVSAGDRTLSSG